MPKIILKMLKQIPFFIIKNAKNAQKNIQKCQTNYLKMPKIIQVRSADPESRNPLKNTENPLKHRKS